MEKVKLSKDWSKYKAGEKIIVDDVRLAWLRDNGFIDDETKEEKKVDPLSGVGDKLTETHDPLIYNPSTHKYETPLFPSVEDHDG